MLKERWSRLKRGKEAIYGGFSKVYNKIADGYSNLKNSYSSWKAYREAVPFRNRAFLASCSLMAVGNETSLNGGGNGGCDTCGRPEDNFVYGALIGLALLAAGLAINDYCGSSKDEEDDAESSIEEKS